MALAGVCGFQQNVAKSPCTLGKGISDNLIDGAIHSSHNFTMPSNFDVWII